MKRAEGRTTMRHLLHRARGTAALLAGAAALGFVVLGNDYAVSVLAYAPGAGGELSPADAIGPPTGGGLHAGSLDTASIGVGGSITLEFAVNCANGPGTDLLVCENPFLVGGGPTAFAEVCFVEVSSDGQIFARFPTRYTGPVGPFLPTAGALPAWYSGLAGARPVLANPPLGPDPLDVVHAGGDAFDFSELLDHPAVLSGDVSVDAIQWVRLVDIETGTVLDDQGVAIWDCGIDSTSATDIDAIVAVNNDVNLGNGRPEVELSLDGAGFLTLHVRDPDGIKDFKQGLSAAVDHTQVPFFSLLPFFLLVQADTQSFTLVTGPVPPGAFPLELRVGAKDKTGKIGGDALLLP
jgi:hypothetical protein